MKIEKKILEGLDLLMRHDSHLLTNDLNERTIIHKLAEHYQNLFPEWHVDCEYNRNLTEPKEIFIEPREIINSMKESIKEILSQDKASNISNTEDLNSLREQLGEEDRIRYDEYIDLHYFLLDLTNGKHTKKRIYPDIIIHKRGTRNNHIVIEAKKTSNTDKKARWFDVIKLYSLVNSPEYKYKQGVFMDIPVKSSIISFTGFKTKEPLKNTYEIIPSTHK